MNQTINYFSSGGGIVTCEAADIFKTVPFDALIRRYFVDAANFFANELQVLEPDSSIRLRRSNMTTSCGSYGGVPIPDRYFDNEVTDADLIVFVTLWTTSNKLMNSATALACRYNSIGRPVFAHMNLNPYYMTTAPGLFTTIKHEIVHALGLSSQFHNRLFDPVRRVTLTKNEIIGSANVFGKQGSLSLCSREISCSLLVFGYGFFPQFNAYIFRIRCVLRSSTLTVQR